MQVLFYTQPFDSTAINNILLNILFEMKSEIETQFVFTEEELKTTGIIVIVFTPTEKRLEPLAFPKNLEAKVQQYIDKFDMSSAINKVKHIRAN